MKALLRTLWWWTLPGLLVCARPAVGETVAGEWRGSVFFHRITAHVYQADTNLWGVARIRRPFGSVNTYHFNGILDGTTVRARHHQGSAFEGELVSSHRVTGTATGRRGRQVRLTLTRRKPEPDTGAP